MGFTATIYSKDEARKMPPKKRPLNYRVSSKIYMAAWDAVGQSTHLKTGNKGQDADRAGKIVTDLCFKIAEELERLGITFEQLNDSK